jgi:hypothetical protein
MSGPLNEINVTPAKDRRIHGKGDRFQRRFHVAGRRIGTVKKGNKVAISRSPVSRGVGPKPRQSPRRRE